MDLQKAINNRFLLVLEWSMHVHLGIHLWCLYRYRKAWGHSFKTKKTGLGLLYSWIIASFTVVKMIHGCVEKAWLLFSCSIYIRKSRDCLLLSLAGCVRACVRASVCVHVRMHVCVSDPRYIQFAFGSCYTVHINALSISWKCTSEATTCRLN